MPIKTIQVAASLDDASWEYEISNCQNVASYVQVSDLTDNRYRGGLRFLGFPCDSRHILIASYLSIYLTTDYTTGNTVRITAEKSLSPTDFGMTSCDPQRTMTTAYVDWNPAGSAGTWINSPSLNTILAEVMGQTGWTDNSPVEFCIVPITAGPTLKFCSYDGTPANAAKLIIEYQDRGQGAML